MVRRDDREYEMQQLGSAEQYRRPGGHGVSAPQRDAEQHEADDVPEDEDGGAEPDGGIFAMLVSRAPVAPGCMPVRAAPSATLSEPATLDQNRHANAA